MIPQQFGGNGIKDSRYDSIPKRLFYGKVAFVIPEHGDGNWKSNST